MKPGDKYFSGELELGVFGKAKILIFKNDFKKDNQPDYQIFLNIEGEKPKKCGALWLQTKKVEESIPEETML